MNDADRRSATGFLSKERIKKHIFRKRLLARDDIADYIDSFYNETNRHSFLSGVSPE
ncbi:hypothetical protein [Ferrovum sp. PN-J185]